MTTYTATAASVQHPSITPDSAGEIYSVRGKLTLPSTLALNDIVELVKLPPDCVPVDFTIDTDALAASGLAMSFGFTTGTVAELRAAAAIGNSAIITRMDSILVSRIAPDSINERIVGAKITTAGTTPAAGILGFTIYYRGALYGA
jgi:hypothetical protein